MNTRNPCRLSGKGFACDTGGEDLISGSVTLLEEKNKRIALSFFASVHLRKDVLEHTLFPLVCGGKHICFILRTSQLEPICHSVSPWAAK